MIRLICTSIVLFLSTVSVADEYRIYIGTYTANSESNGIYAADFDSETGRISNLQLAAATTNPSFIHIDSDGTALYSVAELKQSKDGSGAAIAAWRIDPENGLLTEINRKPAGGDGPCYITVSKDSKFAAVANYGSGSVSVFPLASDHTIRDASGFAQHKGSSTDPNRQKGPHAHSIQFDPSGDFVLAADLGLDQLLVYQFKDGKINPADTPAVKMPGGFGPRHFAFSKDGRFVFVINEMVCKITSFSYSHGKLEEQETVSTIPVEYQRGFSTAEILVHPSGKFVYGSNRGHNSIVVCAFDEKTGKLSVQGNVSTQGKTPRNFRISPDGNWLLAANQNSGNVVVFRIDPEIGMLKATGEEIAVPRPVCIKFVKR